MILHVNHVQPDRTALTTSVVSTLLTVAGEGQVSRRTLDNLNVHLDWVQYKTNFREAVSVRRATKGEELLPWIEVGVDLRQVRQETLKEEFVHALNDVGADATGSRKRIYLEPFAPMRCSLIWTFNKLFWQHRPLWEKATGRGFEKALPTGQSDANHPLAIADSVADVWTLLKDLENQKQLPPEIFVLEIGVGTGQRAALWLNRFRDLDRERGTQYYPRIRFLLADYSVTTLDAAQQTVQDHRELASFLAVDALDPFKSLSFLRYKVLYIHLTNVYDNLPTDELVTRDGRLYFVEVRSYVSFGEAARISETFSVPPAEFTRTVNRLLEAGPQHLSLSDVQQSVGFWRAVWDAIRLEERFVAIEGVSEAPLPPGIRPSQLENFIANAATNQRFHVSSGALESFINTVPLLHPRGYLQVQDIFVTDLADYPRMFRGPGKMDGSIVNWVNGALLAEVGEQAGYDVHFAPFHYREGSRTSILYTTHRE
ncbi:MAG: hypothetical protein DMG13_09055 [Acidobacteria bacterium]|nr:MAG: hypothetical protein DMG13_09055 [Acidobacteriota bacterium]